MRTTFVFDLHAEGQKLVVNPNWEVTKNRLFSFCCWHYFLSILWGILNTFIHFALRPWNAMLFGYSLWGRLFSSADCAVVATGPNRQCLTCLSGPGWPWGSVNIYSVWPWLCRPHVKCDSCSVCSLAPPSVHPQNGVKGQRWARAENR